MIFPLLSSILLFCIWLRIVISRNNRKEYERNAVFWEREAKSNFVRKKSLDGLDYITIPLDKLPFGLIKDNAEISSIENRIKDLSESKIVNLTGISNTDLKLEYGTANLSVLTRYDMNYTTLATTLHAWAKILYENNYFDEALTVLEFAISTKTDVTASYKLAYKIYSENKSLSSTDLQAKLDYLLETANSLNSLSKNGIVSYLDQLKSIS